MGITGAGAVIAAVPFVVVVVVIVVDVDEPDDSRGFASVPRDGAGEIRRLVFRQQQSVIVGIAGRGVNHGQRRQKHVGTFVGT